MDIIVVAGAASGTGKTTVLGDIVKRIKYNTGVLKTSLKEDADSIVTDYSELIDREGSDTAYFKECGAEKVVFLRSSYKELKSNLYQALEMMEGLDYLLIEGNSILDYLTPDLTFYLTRPGKKPKPSAVRAEARADIIINFEEYLKSGKEEKLTSGGDYFRFNLNRISCYKAHLVARTMGIELPHLGNLLNNAGIKVKGCQLGLF